MAKQKYDIKIGLKKFLVQAVIVAIAGCAAVYGDNELWLSIAPIANFIINYVKNK